MRHTHATLLLKAGVPIKVVSERLGHSSVAFTMQIYQHVLPGMPPTCSEVSPKRSGLTSPVRELHRQITDLGLYDLFCRRAVQLPEFFIGIGSPLVVPQHQLLELCDKLLLIPRHG